MNPELGAPHPEGSRPPDGADALLTLTDAVFEEVIERGARASKHPKLVKAYHAARAVMALRAAQPESGRPPQQGGEPSDNGYVGMSDEAVEKAIRGRLVTGWYTPDDARDIRFLQRDFPRSASPQPDGQRFEFRGFTDAEAVFEQVRKATQHFTNDGPDAADVARIIDTVVDALLADPVALRSASNVGEAPSEEPNIYPVVGAVFIAAHRSFEAWREWMDATSDIETRQKAVAHGRVMQELCNALAEAYKVIPLPAGSGAPSLSGDGPTNQCDGCGQKLPLLDGIHYLGELPWIGCTANRYAGDGPRDVFRAARAVPPAEGGPTEELKVLQEISYISSGWQTDDARMVALQRIDELVRAALRSVVRACRVCDEVNAGIAPTAAHTCVTVGPPQPNQEGSK